MTDETVSKKKKKEKNNRTKEILDYLVFDICSQ